MFKKSISFIVIIFVVVLGAMSLVAQETPAPLDPDANACFEGGELFGRCDTSDFNADGVVSQDEKDYAYVYGWYLLRCRVGGFFTEEFCATILPPVFAEEEGASIPAGICIPHASYDQSYLYAPGLDKTEMHLGLTCSNPIGATATLVIASDKGMAYDLCTAFNSNFFPYYVNKIAGVDYYECIISIK
jgi:hypothetical protein